MPEPHLRAADADRAAVADVLGAHMSAGRLTVAEFDERLSRAYAAKTYGELDAADRRPPAARREHAGTGPGAAAGGRPRATADCGRRAVGRRLGPAPVVARMADAPA